jgi:hypothetical protein
MVLYWSGLSSEDWLRGRGGVLDDRIEASLGREYIASSS